MKLIFKIKTLLFFLSALLIGWMVPAQIKADVRINYEYKDINVCYVNGQNSTLDRTRDSETGKYFCIPANTDKQVDSDRLREENACGGGYELYNKKFEIGDDRPAFGYGCRRKKSVTTSNLYCTYNYSRGAALLYLEGDTTGVRTQWRGMGDDMPEYDDSNWENVSGDFEIDADLQYGVCPKLLLETFDGSNVVGFKFYDFEPSSSAYTYDLVAEKYVTYTQEYDESGELEPPPSGGQQDYYSKFYPNDVDQVISSNVWTNKCAYLDGNMELYFNNQRFVMKYNYSTWLYISANFTLSELLQKNNGECPNELYYATDGTEFYLEDLDSGTHYRDKTSLYVVEPELAPTPGDPAPGGCDVIPEVIRIWIKDTLNLVKYVVLVVVIVLGILDFLKAAGSGEAEAMKKAGTDFLKRVIAVIVLFLLPLIVDLILNLIEIYGADSTCL